MSALSHSWLLPEKKQLSRWLGVISTYATVQVVVQCLTFLCGISIIRTLSKQDYAIYTIAGSSLALISSLSDLGIGNALLARGGKVWQDKVGLGQLVRTALSLRRFLFLFGALIATAYFFVLTLRVETPLPSAILIWVLLLANALLQLNYTLWSVAPRLHAQISRLQRLDLATAALRLSLVLGCLRFLNTPIAVAINGAGFLLQALVGRKWARGLIDPAARDTPENRKEILKLVKAQAPNAVFYCFYTQSAVMAISFFGHSKQIAEVGALTRLGILFTILASVMTTVVLPGFARIQTRRAVASRYFQVIVAFLIGAFMLLLVAMIFPAQLAWILGGRYRGVAGDVKWIVAATLASSFVGLVWSLNAARGWVTRAWLTIPLMILTLIMSGWLLLDLSTVRGAVLLGACAEVSALLVLIPLAALGCKGLPGDR